MSPIGVSWMFVLDFAAIIMAILCSASLIAIFKTTGSKAAMAGLMFEAFMALVSMVYLSPFQSIAAWSLIRAAGRIGEAVTLFGIILWRLKTGFNNTPDPTAIVVTHTEAPVERAGQRIQGTAHH